jgi:hypothetical protein
MLHWIRSSIVIYGEQELPRFGSTSGHCDTELECQITLSVIYYLLLTDHSQCFQSLFLEGRTSQPFSCIPKNSARRRQHSSATDMNVPSPRDVFEIGIRATHVGRHGSHDASVAHFSYSVNAGVGGYWHSDVQMRKLLLRQPSNVVSRIPDPGRSSTARQN